jgi:hypothetical protein
VHVITITNFAYFALYTFKHDEKNTINLGYGRKEKHLCISFVKGELLNRNLKCKTNKYNKYSKIKLDFEIVEPVLIRTLKQQLS